MEPLTRDLNSVSEDADESAAVGSRTNPKQKAKTVDRVTLGPAEAGRLSKWLSQVNESTNGFLILSRSDLVNFLVRSHQDELTQKEIAQVCTHHYDPLRYIAWIAPQIKVALEIGDVSRVAKLQDELRNVKLTRVSEVDHRHSELAVSGTPRVRPKRKAKLEPENTYPPLEITSEKA
jgi:hypothetical protein